MEERKPLSKKTRFEVFKRDFFTCQYCGQKAPEVILEVDHINPVSKGGKNELLNLITSCYNCNRGKRHIKLSDNSIVEKQRAQIEELNLRRQQLEMILKWRDGVEDIENKTFRAAIDAFNKKFDKYCLSELGEKDIIKYVKKHGIADTLNAIDISVEKYKQTDEDFRICLKKIGGILNYKNLPHEKQKILYIKGICRNKFDDFKEPKISIKLNQYFENGYDLDQLQKMLVNKAFESIQDMYMWMEE